MSLMNAFAKRFGQVNAIGKMNLGRGDATTSEQQLRHTVERIDSNDQGQFGAGNEEYVEGDDDVSQNRHGKANKGPPGPESLI